MFHEMNLEYLWQTEPTGLKGTQFPMYVATLTTPYSPNNSLQTYTHGHWKVIQEHSGLNNYEMDKLTKKTLGQGGDEEPEEKIVEQKTEKNSQEHLKLQSGVCQKAFRDSLVTQY